MSSTSEPGVCFTGLEEAPPSAALSQLSPDPCAWRLFVADFVGVVVVRVPGSRWYPLEKKTLPLRGAPSLRMLSSEPAASLCAVAACRTRSRSPRGASSERVLPCPSTTAATVAILAASSSLRWAPSRLALRSAFAPSFTVCSNPPSRPKTSPILISRDLTFDSCASFCSSLASSRPSNCPTREPSLSMVSCCCTTTWSISSICEL
mmetsp:Transcript_30914/g.55336  ORF Transcript_30914/g.55336 Transcript_30914/m.55336 type:complete len:206 (+) Transcript_30914:74-691(+)